jgi:Thiamine-binding protein
LIVALSISPSGSPLDGTTAPDAGVSEAVAEAIGVIRASGLPCETNAMFTNIEGECSEVSFCRTANSAGRGVGGRAGDVGASTGRADGVKRPRGATKDTDVAPYGQPYA